MRNRQLLDQHDLDGIGWIAAKHDNDLTDSVSVPTSQTRPFSDAFAAHPSTQPLSANWLERSGNFSVGSTKAVAPSQPSINLTTLNGLSTANGVLQANVVMSARGSSP